MIYRSCVELYCVLLYFIWNLFRPCMSQYPNHVDLQNIGEIVINSKKYDIVRPTIHVAEEHVSPALAQPVSDFILRRDNSDSKRIFIDHNGLRHYWMDIRKEKQFFRTSKLTSEELLIIKANILTSSQLTPKDKRTKNVLQANMSSSNYYLIPDTTYFEDVLKIIIGENLTSIKIAKQDLFEEKGNNSDEYWSRKSNKLVSYATTYKSYMDSKPTKSKTNHIMVDELVKNITEHSIINSFNGSDVMNLPHNEAETDKKNITNTIKLKQTLKKRISRDRRHRKRKQKLSRLTVAAAKPLLRQPKTDTMTMVTIKFFCPYMGIFSMHSYLEDDTTMAAPGVEVVSEPQYKLFDV